MNPLLLLPKVLEDIIIDYKEQLEAFQIIEDTKVQMRELRKPAYNKTYKSLFNDLNNNKETYCHEMVERKTIVKPYIDYEYVGENIDEVKNKVLNKLCDIFNVKQEEWAISSNTRDMGDTKRSTLHFILWTKKVKMSDVREIILENEWDLNKFGGHIETAIYRGFSAFRIPMTTKTYRGEITKDTYLKPENHSTYEEFHKHIITITEDCEEL